MGLLSLVLFPFVGLWTALKGLWWIIAGPVKDLTGAVIAAPSAIRISVGYCENNNKCRQEIGSEGCKHVVFLAISSIWLVIIIIANAIRLGLEGYQGYHGYEHMSLVLFGTNILSGLYELGRWKNSQNKPASARGCGEAKENKTEDLVAEKPIDTDFITMYSQFRGAEISSKEQVEKFEAEITDALKQGRITLSEACKLKAVVDHGYQQSFEMS